MVLCLKVMFIQAWIEAELCNICLLCSIGIDRSVRACHLQTTLPLLTGLHHCGLCLGYSALFCPADGSGWDPPLPPLHTAPLTSQYRNSTQHKGKHKEILASNCGRPLVIYLAAIKIVLVARKFFENAEELFHLISFAIEITFRFSLNCPSDIQRGLVV